MESNSISKLAATQKPTYDTFISYNSRDALLIELIAESIAKNGNLQLFFDRWDLLPGSPIQETLERAIASTETCVVFLGKNGLGPWQTEEVRLALSRRVDEGNFRVIPVLLPGIHDNWKADLPAMLLRYSVLDMREGFSQQEQVDRLIQAITGRHPIGSTLSNALLHQFRRLEDETLELLDGWKKVDLMSPANAFMAEVIIAYLTTIVLIIVVRYYAGDNPFKAWSLARMFWESLWMNAAALAWSLLMSLNSSLKSLKKEKQIYREDRAKLDRILQARQTLLGVKLPLEEMHSMRRCRCPKCEKVRVSILACSKARVLLAFWYGWAGGFVLAVMVTVALFLLFAGRLLGSIGIGIITVFCNYFFAIKIRRSCGFVCTTCGTEFEKSQSLLL